MANYTKTNYINNVTLFDAKNMNKLENKLAELDGLVQGDGGFVDYEAELIKFLDMPENFNTAVQYLNSYYDKIESLIDEINLKTVFAKGSYINIKDSLIITEGVAKDYKINGETRHNLMTQEYYFVSSNPAGIGTTEKKNGIVILAETSLYEGNRFITMGQNELLSLLKPDTDYTITFQYNDKKKNTLDSKFTFAICDNLMKDYIVKQDVKVVNGWNRITFHTSDNIDNIYAGYMRMNLFLPINKLLDIEFGWAMLQEGKLEGEYPYFFEKMYSINSEPMKLRAIKNNLFNIETIKNTADIKTDERSIDANKSSNDNSLKIEQDGTYPMILDPTCEYKLMYNVELIPRALLGNVAVTLYEDTADQMIIYQKKILPTETFIIDKFTFKADHKINKVKLRIDLSYEYRGRAIISDIQLKESYFEDDYESFVGNSIDLPIPTELRNIGDICDKFYRKNGQYMTESYIGMNDLNYEDFELVTDKNMTNQYTVLFVAKGFNDKYKARRYSAIKCTNLLDRGDITDGSTLLMGVYNKDNDLYIRLNKSSLASYDLEGLRRWISRYVVKIYYIKNKVEFSNVNGINPITTYEGATSLFIDTKYRPYIELSVPIALEETIRGILLNIQDVSNLLSRVDLNVREYYYNLLQSYKKLNELKSIVDNL